MPHMNRLKHETTLSYAHKKWLNQWPSDFSCLAAPGSSVGPVEVATKIRGEKNNIIYSYK